MGRWSDPLTVFRYEKAINIVTAKNCRIYLVLEQTSVSVNTVTAFTTFTPAESFYFYDLSEARLKLGSALTGCHSMWLRQHCSWNFTGVFSRMGMLRTRPLEKMWLCGRQLGLHTWHWNVLAAHFRQVTQFAWISVPFSIKGRKYNLTSVCVCGWARTCVPHTYIHLPSSGLGWWEVFHKYHLLFPFLFPWSTTKMKRGAYLHPGLSYIREPEIG